MQSMDNTHTYLYNSDMLTKEHIYLDYAAATPMSDSAREAYCDATRHFANPQALHTPGLRSAHELLTARRDIGCVLGVKADELVFTSGGTEANNLALAGYLYGIEESGKKIDECHVVVSTIEHPSVREVLVPFIARGLQVTTVAPNSHGEITPEALRDALTPTTVLISVALVNSEIGTVQPLHALAAATQQHNEQHGSNALIHTDATQSMYTSYMPHSLGVDLLTLDSGKVYGPRGVGVLFVRHGVHLAPIILGGSQESGIRGGTENVALAAGFAQALKDVQVHKSTESERLFEIRNAYIVALCKALPDCVINGSGKQQSPHILNISVPDIDAEYVAMWLDQRGVALSTKSACLLREGGEQSFVVNELTTADDVWRASTTLRLSFGRETNAADVAQVCGLIHEGVVTYRNFGK